MKRILFWLAASVLLLALALSMARTAAPPAAAAAQEEELETFVPSEELPADAAVSFPVDI